MEDQNCNKGGFFLLKESRNKDVNVFGITYHMCVRSVSAAGLREPQPG